MLFERKNLHPSLAIIRTVLKSRDLSRDDGVVEIEYKPNKRKTMDRARLYFRNEKLYAVQVDSYKVPIYQRILTGGKVKRQDLDDVLRAVGGDPFSPEIVKTLVQRQLITEKTLDTYVTEHYLEQISLILKWEFCTGRLITHEYTSDFTMPEYDLDQIVRFINSRIAQRNSFTDELSYFFKRDEFNKLMPILSKKINPQAYPKEVVAILSLSDRQHTIFQIAEETGIGEAVVLQTVHSLWASNRVINMELGAINVSYDSVLKQRVQAKLGERQDDTVNEHTLDMKEALVPIAPTEAEEAPVDFVDESLIRQSVKASEPQAPAVPEVDHSIIVVEDTPNVPTTKEETQEVPPETEDAPQGTQKEEDEVAPSLSVAPVEPVIAAEATHVPVSDTVAESVTPAHEDAEDAMESQDVTESTEDVTEPQGDPNAEDVEEEADEEGEEELTQEESVEDWLARLRDQVSFDDEESEEEEVIESVLERGLDNLPEPTVNTTEEIYENAMHQLFGNQVNIVEETEDSIGLSIVLPISTTSADSEVSPEGKAEAQESALSDSTQDHELSPVEAVTVASMDHAEPEEPLSAGVIENPDEIELEIEAEREDVFVSPSVEEGDSALQGNVVVAESVSATESDPVAEARDTKADESTRHTTGEEELMAEEIASWSLDELVTKLTELRNQSSEIDVEMLAKKQELETIEARNGENTVDPARYDALDEMRQRCEALYEEYTVLLSEYESGKESYERDLASQNNGQEATDKLKQEIDDLATRKETINRSVVTVTNAFSTGG